MLDEVAEYMPERDAVTTDASGGAKADSHRSNLAPNGSQGSVSQCEAMTWYVGRCLAFDGAQAAERARAAGFNAIFPRQIERRAGRDDVIVPVFVGYLFVSFDVENDDWGRLMQPPIGLVSIIRRQSNGVPAMLPAGFVETFMREADGKGVFEHWWPGSPPALPVSRVGKTYRVDRGPWAGFIGACSVASRDRIGLLLDIFGRKALVKFRDEQVSEV